jgi:hypothetical protein
MRTDFPLPPPPFLRRASSTDQTGAVKGLGNKRRPDLRPPRSFASDPLAADLMYLDQGGRLSTKGGTRHRPDIPHFGEIVILVRTGQVLVRTPTSSEPVGISDRDALDRLFGDIHAHSAIAACLFLNEFTGVPSKMSPDPPLVTEATHELSLALAGLAAATLSRRYDEEHQERRPEHQSAVMDAQDQVQNDHERDKSQACPPGPYVFDPEAYPYERVGGA